MYEITAMLFGKYSLDEELEGSIISDEIMNIVIEESLILS